jgi:hypothetical protein
MRHLNWPGRIQRRRPRGARRPRAFAAGFVIFCALLGFGVVKGAAVATAAAGAAAQALDAPRVSGPEDVGADATRDRAAALLQVLNGHVVLWRIQHDGRMPDFGRYAAWEQFLQTTDAAGWPSGGTQKTGSFRIDPYLPKLPVSPINGLGTVAVVHGDVRDEELPGNRRAGFVLVLPAGNVRVTDESGARVLDVGPE